MLGNLIPNLNAFQAEYGLLFLCGYLGYLLYKKFDLFLGLAFTYFAYSSLRILYHPQVKWPMLDIVNIAGLESLVAEALLALIIFAAAFLLMRKEFLNFIRLSLIGLFFVELVALTYLIGYFLIWPGTDQAHTPYFLFNNTAIDVAFLLCTLPVVCDYFGENIFTLGIICLSGLVAFLSDTSTGILGLGVFLAVYVGSFLFISYGFLIWLFYTVLGLLTLIFAGFALQGTMLLNGSGRYEIWKMSYEYFLQQGQHYTGLGLGTFQMFGPLIQIDNAIAHGAHDTNIVGFIWMHNDWLQVLFESGLIGLVVTAAVFTMAIYKSRSKPAIFTALITFGAVAIIQMPLRWIFFDILAAWLLVEAFSAAKEKRT